MNFQFKKCILQIKLTECLSLFIIQKQIQEMKKMYMGSSKLNSHFKMFRVKYQEGQDVDTIKNDIMNKMNQYLGQYDGRLINVKQLRNCSQLLFYFVTGQDGVHEHWEQYLRNNLLKNYHICPNVIELGPTY